ncbi:MAG: metal-dependent hydrolase [Vicinamibacterales bacterium]
MDNITHSLVGVTLADLAMGNRGAKGQRPLFVGAGIIAANLPDIDLAYTRITTFPLGYLLHHRGHTHTFAGLGVLALAMMSAYWWFPSVRTMRLSLRLRFWLLVAIALASHLALDSLNSYGVHPFYPFDNTWYFGDAVFILEPWIWLTLGVAVAWNGRSRAARLAAALPLLILLATIASTRVVPLEAVAAFAIVGGAFVFLARRLSPQARAAAALAVCVAIATAFIVASGLARTAAVRALARELRGQVVDVILTPNPSSPLCWAVIAIELRSTSAEYLLWRGTLSLAPAWKAPTACASHQFAGTSGVRIIGDGQFALRDVNHQPLQRLRTLARNDCWVRAWLQFGRAPVIERGSIYDLRFAERIGQDFSSMRIGAREGCPRYVPDWEMPRADLLR